MPVTSVCHTAGVCGMRTAMQDTSRETVEDALVKSKPRLFHHAYARLGHREDAEDIVQETLVRACRSLSGFRSEAALMTWLTAICTNLCIDHIRKRSRQSAGVTRFAVCQMRDHSLISNPSQQAEAEAVQELVCSALKELPDHQRRLIESRDIELRTYEEIAASLGCSPEYSKVRVFRARRMLRKRVLADLEMEHSPRREGRSCRDG